MVRNYFIVFNIVLIISLLSCRNEVTFRSDVKHVRVLRDTTGFAHYPWQMDSLMKRIKMGGWSESEGLPLKLAICPHDDYTYVGALYPQLLQFVKAPNLILIGVAHKAAQFGIEDSLVFDNYSHWKGPWKDIPVSPLREDIFRQLTGRFAIKNDSLQEAEHSVEALIPYLQYFNRNISIVPILVPAMSPDRMKECGKALAEAVRVAAKNRGWEWGKDFAIVVTTDAVHYGDEDWGGKDMAFFGCDDAGNRRARHLEYTIIRSCFSGELTQQKIRLFSDYTLKSDNYREYKWTWCGRYSVPVALYASYFLDDSKKLRNELADYSTSITQLHIPVDDLGMGHTAIATPCHWVGYAALGYR
jgi:MEMO1 family protein